MIIYALGSGFQVGVAVVSGQLIPSVPFAAIFAVLFVIGLRRYRRLRSP